MNRAAALSIAVHEWPLPERTELAQNVVFELKLPHAFRVWRELTFQLLVDICGSETDTSTPVDSEGELRTYEGLRGHFAQSPFQRLGLASRAKSFLKAHYAKKSLPTMEASILVPNGLQFSLYDTKRNQWTVNSFQQCDTSRYCTFTIPFQSPYRALQSAVTSTAGLSNATIASQSDCAPSLDVNEFVAFGSLRSGGRLQWINIAREMRSRALSFDHPSVQLLLMETIWQIGPTLGVDEPIIDRLEWHAELGTNKFVSCLVEELNTLLVSVKANWLQTSTVQIIILITTRLLTFTPASTDVTSIFTLLHDARGILLSWLRDLAKTLCDCSDQKSAVDLRLRLCEVAAICRSTYNIDQRFIELIFPYAMDIAAFIECGIVLYDNAPPMDAVLTPELRVLLDRDRRLAFFIESHLATMILADAEGLNAALYRFWPTYCPGTCWRQLDCPNERWFSALTGEPDPQQVHLNIVTGRFLVGGKPVSRLPREITETATYIRLFESVGH